MKTKTYTMEEFLSIQRALRKTLAMPQEDFSVQDLLRMLSDEVRALHMNGYDDDGVARLIRLASGQPFSAEELKGQRGDDKQPDYWKTKPRNVDRDTAPAPAVSLPDPAQPAPEPTGPPVETPLQPSPFEDPGHGVPDENPAPISPPDLPSRTPDESPASTPLEIPSAPSVAPAESNPSVAPTYE